MVAIGLTLDPGGRELTVTGGRPELGAPGRSDARLCHAGAVPAAISLTCTNGGRPERVSTWLL
jgi:hypothetical protein